MIPPQAKNFEIWIISETEGEGNHPQLLAIFAMWRERIKMGEIPLHLTKVQKTAWILTFKTCHF